MISWTKSSHAYLNYDIVRYDAKVGVFHIGTQDNGEGWWNWWIALAEQGPVAGEHMIVETGGAKSARAAKAAITAELQRQLGLVHAQIAHGKPRWSVFEFLAALPGDAGFEKTLASAKLYAREHQIAPSELWGAIIAEARKQCP